MPLSLALRRACRFPGLPTTLALVAATVLATSCSEPASLVQQPGVESHSYSVVELIRGLERPWGMAFLPDGDILITERPGRVRRVQGGELLPMALRGGPTAWVGGQGGLLDIALHPDFLQNRFVYFSYSKEVEVRVGGSTERGITTAVARARWNGEFLEGLEDIFVATPAMGTGRHFGSRLLFDRQGYLWITVGEMGLGDPAQDLGSHAGTTVRLFDDGGVPPDNPFAGEESLRAGHLPEIFSYGHRNPQGLALRPGTGSLEGSGDVWLHEHGPRGGDAIHRVLPGANYGWPEVSFGREYTFFPIPDPEPGQGVHLPLHYWTPSIAPSGMVFYSGDRFPHWEGDLFAGALAGRHLRRVVFHGTEVVHEEVLLAEYGQRIRDVRVGPDGYLYFLTDSDQGVLGRLEPSN